MNINKSRKSITVKHNIRNTENTAVSRIGTLVYTHTIHIFLFLFTFAYRCVFNSYRINFSIIKKKIIYFKIERDPPKLESCITINYVNNETPVNA